MSTTYIHSHNFLGVAHDANAKRTLWVVLLTVVMMVGEIAAGHITGSMALLADGFHMATHAGALGIAAAAYAYARKHSESSIFSFGTGKVGDLGGFASALILGLISLGIGIESVLRLFEPTQVQFGTATLIAITGLIVNVVSALLLAGGGHHHDHGHGHSHGHSHGPHGHMHGEDNNLRSAYVHVLADAVTSVLAIVALLAGKFLGWVWLDPVMGLVGAVVIARWAWSLMKDTASVLLDKTDNHVAEEIRGLLSHSGKLQITDLHVWRVGPEARAAIVSVTGSLDFTADDIRAALTPVHEVAHLTVEYRAAAS
ncbi:MULTISPECIES: CDF family Co(II)/Ni(II) efflux transporter DmeF [Pseudomonas]|uniref:CDF family Co(II)/Ni(II) efflux transporter DmeF n=1 Tax=Pseudomonas TaxID=286 RepID=UPI000AD28A8A|nr:MULTISPECIES: CDF family Co(II)/Ni(II) efflux transporter DmeF [Pseudomonas]MCE0778686.1 CDF family Co(II)/Ni(II) efflux transporter DmeF [Pseudomonas sp. NMI542_15]MCE0963245.1 CDF family Co(II)/Ni(II) efflux transporter DmeF [Pseudomonas putida]MDD1985666.1 CDF family Co(II)/Ni(II) efflux transporter DmeF [Pseudomonas putida]MDD2118358.1 CDF family Co(II)/Ni(II) efflux transporter DmeF [Pseudomonas putida]UPU95631.1 CDF family Co(II)/Ni(II) efflux transporter DmeF [Pseudomonas putida]